MAEERADQAPARRLLLLLLHFCRGRTENHRGLQTSTSFKTSSTMMRSFSNMSQTTQGVLYCFEVTDVWFSLRRGAPLKVTLGHTLPGAGSAQAGRAGPTRENRRGGGRGRLAWTVMLEQNIHAASAG